MATGGNDIDSLKFSIVLDSDKFEKEMKRVEGLAKSFESSVQKALNTSKLLELAEKGMVKETKQKAAAQKEVVLLTRQELEAKKAAGTITDKELKQLKSLIAADKALLDEENKKLTSQKKQLDIESKNLTIQQKKERAERSHSAAVSSTNTKLTSQNVLLKQAAGYLGAYFSLYGGISLVNTLVRITGEFEAQRAALRAILQDAAGADRIFYQLQELAVKSPYTFKDLTSYAKQLSAFSVPMDEIYETTKKLADVSAGLGVDMSRIILAYGQVRSASFLRGQEVRQFTEAGIPILAELAEQFKEIEGHAVSTGEVFDRISKRQVPFEMVEEAFRRMTSEGGKFYNMQEVLAETVKGKLSNLQDAWEIMLSRVGDANSGLIKGTISFVTELIKNYEKLGKVILEVAVAYGAYKAVLASTNALQAAAAVSARFLAVTGSEVTKLDVIFHGLFRNTTRGFKQISGIIAKHPYAAAIAAALAGLTALGVKLYEMNEHLREADKITSKAVANAESSKSTIHYYIQKFKEAKEGTEEYNKARQAIIDNSRNFISATDAERLSLENVDEVWQNICTHIEEATKLQAIQSVTANAAAKKQASQLDVMDKLADYQNRNKLSDEVRMLMADAIRGDIDEMQLRASLVGKVDRSTGGTYQPGTVSDIVFWVKQWKQDYDKAQQIFDDTIKRAEQNMSDYAGTGKKPGDTPPDPLTGWRANVDAYLKKVGGGTRGMEVSDATNLADYIKKGAEALNDAREALKHTPVSDADYKAIEKEIAFYEGISEAIYGKGHTEFDNTTTKYKAGAKDAETVRKERLDDLKDELRYLKELKGYYDRLKELGLSDDTIAGIFAPYGRAIPAGGFASSFEDLATQAEALGDSSLATEIRNFASGKDLAKEVEAYEARQNALEKFISTFQDLIDKTKEYNGTGVGGDISKGIADYRKEIAESITEMKSLAAQARSAGLGGYLDPWIATIGTTKQSNSFEKLKKLILGKDDALLKEILSSYDLTNWTDKSLLQIKQIETALEDIEVPDEIKEMLKDYPELLAALEETLRQLADKKLANTIAPEKFKAAKREVKEIVGEFKKLADSAGEFADKLGATALSEAAHGLSDLVGIAEKGVTAFSSISEKVAELQDMAKNSKEGSWLSKIFGAGGMLDSSTATKAAGVQAGLGATAGWISAIIALNMKVLELAAAEEAQWKREDAARRAARNVGRMQGGYTGTFFGSSDISTFNSRMEQLKRVQESMKKIQDQADKMQFTTRSFNFWQRALGWMNSENWTDGQLLPNELKGLGEIMKALRLEMYDEYGNLNAESLKQILESYEDLEDGERAWIEQAIQDSEDYAEAMKAIEGILEDMFGSVADDMVDAMLNSFHTIGDAAEDLGDTFTNLGDTILRSFLRSYVLDNILAKYKDDATNMMAKYAAGGMTDDEYAAWLEKFTQDVQQDAKNQSEAINGLIEAFDKRGIIDWGDSDSGDSMGSGIKSITEDTANLLASYINAIRADVSYGRIQWERIAVASEDQAARYITLNDYMAQVAANTFDTAQNTQRILNELQSVIGAEGSSGSIVRVQMS